MKIKTFLLTLLMAVTLTATISSCSTKQHAISDLRSLSKDLRKNSAEYTVAEWKDRAERFVEIRREIARHEYTPAQKKEIGELEGECAGYMAKGLKEGFLNKVLGIKNELKGILKGILNTTFFGDEDQ